MILVRICDFLGKTIEYPLIDSQVGSTICPMSGKMLVAALAMLAVAGITRWALVRRWARYYANPAGNLVFPTICPVCLSQADTVVEEESKPRETANYIVVRQLAWWNAKIPHCSKCKRKQGRNFTIGLVLGAICSLFVFLLSPPPEPDFGVILYIFFGFPLYVLATTIQKGVVLGWGDAKALSMRIKNSEYFDRLIALNSPDGTAPDVPLAGNRGVWRRRL